MCLTRKYKDILITLEINLLPKNMMAFNKNNKIGIKQVSSLVPVLLQYFEYLFTE